MTSSPREARLLVGQYASIIGGSRYESIRGLVLSATAARVSDDDERAITRLALIDLRAESRTGLLQNRLVNSAESADLARSLGTRRGVVRRTRARPMDRCWVGADGFTGQWLSTHHEGVRVRC